MERAVARIDAGAVERNCAHLDATVGEGVELCAVVKADGYGHGADACATAALAGGATRLAVATGGEAAQIGRRFPHVPLLTMGALTEQELDMALAAGSEVAVWHEEFRAMAASRARAQGRPARLHVKHDSGMGRLGNRDAGGRRSPSPAPAPRTRTWSWPASGPTSRRRTNPTRSSSTSSSSASRRWPARSGPSSPAVTVHAANSAAVFREPRAHFDMVRCGVAVYGLDPFQGDPAERGLSPAMSLRSYVADVKRFAPGDSAGYGRSWKAAEPTKIGVLPIGYGDGVRRGLTNNGEVLVRGRRHPLVGTVSMDNVTIELGAETEVEPGDEAVLIGAQGEEAILAEEVAARLDTINYEVTCGISARVPRA